MQGEQFLVKRAKNGDERAFEELVCAYEKKIYNLAYRTCMNEQDAMDITQEVFLRIYRSIGRFKEEASFSTWVYRITSNLCIDFTRKAVKHQAASLTVRDEDGEFRDLEIPDDAPSPEEQQYAKEQHREVERAIASLSPEHSQMVMLRDVNGLSYDEIAEILDISTGTVKSRLARARAKLAAFLQKGNFFEEVKSKELERGCKQ